MAVCSYVFWCYCSWLTMVKKWATPTNSREQYIFGHIEQRKLSDILLCWFRDPEAIVCSLFCIVRLTSRPIRCLYYAIHTCWGRIKKKSQHYQLLWTAAATAEHKSCSGEWFSIRTFIKFTLESVQVYISVVAIFWFVSRSVSKFNLFSISKDKRYDCRRIEEWII